MVTHGPLHRSGRAELPHPAPTLGGDAQALAACRTRSSALSAWPRRGVRNASPSGRFPLAKPLPSTASAAGSTALFGSFVGVGSEEARLRAGLRPPPKLHVRFSRMQLSRRLNPPRR